MPRVGSNSASGRGTPPTTLSLRSSAQRGSADRLLSSSREASLIGASVYSWDLHVTSSCHRIKIYSVNKSKPATAARLAEIEAKGVSFNPLTMPLEWSLESVEDYLKYMRKHPREPLN